jgi:hypothetical protein
VVRVPGYTTEMYCAFCEVRTEFICYVEESRPPLWSSGQNSWLHNADILCFLSGTNWIYICYVEESMPLWSNGQSFWLQGSVFHSRHYQIFWEVVGLERCPFSLVSTIEELLGRNNKNSGLGKPRLQPYRIHRADYEHPSIRKVGTNFADKRRSFGRYGSLAD